MALIPNIWHLRRVADTSAKPCVVCFKPSASVLITPDSALTKPEQKKDFFYTCDSHLLDRHFASPKISPEEVAAKKKKEELDKEIEKVKEEYEEKMKSKKKKKKDKKKKEEEAVDDEKDKKERDDKIQALEKSEPKPDDGPRVFELHKDIYQMRVSKLQAAQLAKRNQERLRNPTLFPTVPTGNP